jgi:tetrahydromethanopterin S-methyltransferase subunit E
VVIDTVFVLRVVRDSMEGTYRVNRKEGDATGNAVGVVLYVCDWIHVLDGPSVKYSIISTGHALFFFGT